jgi:chromate transporter
MWPHGFAGSFDWISALMTVAATVALFRFKLGVMQVISASAVTGLLVRLFL